MDSSLDEQDSEYKPWFKLWSEILGDTKVRSLPMAHRWVFVALMAWSSKQPEPVRGQILGLDDPDTADLIALEVADGDLDLLRVVVKRLCLLKILGPVPGGLALINWHKRQHQKPSDRPEATRLRKQAQRERQRAAAQASEAGLPESADVTRKGVIVTPVTPMSRANVTQTRRRQEEDEKEEEESRARSINGHAEKRDATHYDTSSDTPAPSAFPITDEMHRWWVQQCQTRGLAPEKQERTYLEDLTVDWLAKARRDGLLATNWTAMWRRGMGYRIDWAVADATKAGGRSGGTPSSNSQWAARAIGLAARGAADAEPGPDLQPGRAPLTRPEY